jgi:hypothetical protein
MGFLNLFAKPPPKLVNLSAGSFTVDEEGRVVVSTLPMAFPEPLVQRIATEVLTTFRSAQNLQLPLTEIVIHYPSLKLTARELRGGAMIFLAPQSLSTKKNPN